MNKIKIILGTALVLLFITSNVMCFVSGGFSAICDAYYKTLMMNLELYKEFPSIICIFVTGIGTGILFYIL